MSILVTGGAGYIGSVAVQQLLAQGEDVVVIDNLAKGLRRLVPEQIPFYEIDLVDKTQVEQVFQKHPISAVLHFAGYKAVGESMETAVKYSDNITGTLNLLNCMVKYNCKKIIFSSSAAVYGGKNKEIITEEGNIAPASYYGYTKRAVEELLGWYEKIHAIKYIAFRYFNVGGDKGFLYVDPQAQNVLPIIMETITGKREFFEIYGTDYATRDGTCIRDYISIGDLVRAHLLGLETNFSGVLNLGTGTGTTVQELVQATEDVVGQTIPVKIGPRRKGDAAASIASFEKAQEVLGWKPQETIKDIVRTTYRAYKKTL